MYTKRFLQHLKVRINVRASYTGCLKFVSYVYVGQRSSVRIFMLKTVLLFLHE